jgi:hypothetical protein
MTSSLARGSAIAALAVALTATTFATEAEAQRRGRIVGGVAAGLIIGGLVAGAAAANARERVYVAPRASCGEYKRRAIWNEENGRGGRAQYWWDQYEACRGG